MTYLSLFRTNLDKLMQAYMDATGAPKTALSKLVAGYPNFYAYYQRSDMRAGSYDAAVARFSAIWPTDLPWPDGIDRPAPAELSTSDLLLLAQIERRRPSSDWPADKPWPADIPRPVHSSQDVGGQGA